MQRRQETRARICNPFLRSPGIDFQPGYIGSGGEAQESNLPGWESIPGPLQRFSNTGSGGPVRQPFAYFVPSPHRGLKFPTLGSLKVYKFGLQCVSLPHKTKKIHKVFCRLCLLVLAMPICAQVQRRQNLGKFRHSY